MKILAAVIGLAGLLYLGAATALYLNQRTLLFRPERIDLTPGELGLTDVEVRRLTAADGTGLVAWFRRGQGRRLILFLHGTGGALAHRAQRFGQLAGLGGSVLAIDYRGFGGSQGTPSEGGLAQDAEAAYRFALASGFAPADIVLLGESLGTGVALRLAAREPVGGVVLSGAYTSIRDVAADRYWMFPIRLGLRDPFDAAVLLPQVEAPVLVLHGGKDQVIPLRFAERLVQGAGTNVTAVTIPDGPHLVLDDPAAERSLREWLARLPGDASGPGPRSGAASR